jgi:hypothetical protein
MTGEPSAASIRCTDEIPTFAFFASSATVHRKRHSEPVGRPTVSYSLRACPRFPLFAAHAATRQGAIVHVFGQDHVIAEKERKQGVIMVQKSKPESAKANSSVPKSKTEPTPSKEPTPAKFTPESLRALGFEVPEPDGTGFVIGIPRPIK